MRKLFYLFALSFFCLNFAACNQDVDIFDNGENYIYFDLPYAVDAQGRVTTKRVDSLEYSFALEDYSVTEYVFRIPVNTIGLASDSDRAFRVEVVKDSTNAAPEDWDASVIANPVIRAGKLSDTLFIKINRREILKEQTRHITLRLLPNENFKLGDNASLSAKISFSDILIPPTWWPKWKGYFGEFYREVFIKWQEIYHEGADPNTDLYGNEKPLYWGNMPYYVNSNWYPSTFMFITALKQYFQDNEIYPDGDTSKPRIQLP